ncbi:MAG TPA: DUF5683 domain-containing protein [Rhodothermales bacterium]|nr:DUF5683 domain-containing protein [Rhodothermales bacterium]
MARFLHIVLLLTLGSVLWAPTAAAQSQPLDSLLTQMRQAYEQLDYGRVQNRAATILATHDSLTSEQLIEVHTMLGVVSYSTGNEAEARRQFEAALAIAPDLSLDPAKYSPKILSFVEEVKADRNTEPLPVDSVQVRYVTLQNPIPAAAVRSLILPGWGQIYKGQQTKGGAFMGLWGVAASGFIASEIVYVHFSRAYDKAMTTEDAARLYDRKNTWFKVRNLVGLGAAGIWVYSYLDTILSPVPPVSVQLGEQSSLNVRPGPGSLHLTLRF